MTEQTPSKTEKPEETEAVLADPIWVWVIAITYIVLAVFNIYSLTQFWPSSTEDPQPVKYFIWSFTIYDEVRLIAIVTMAGVLGSLVHGLRSLFWYVGNRRFVKSWILMYFLIPFVGATLSLVFYLVLRGGLFSGQATVQDTSPFGFAGLAGLIGMFSNQAALKLKEVAQSVFQTSESTTGEDHVAPKQ